MITSVAEHNRHSYIRTPYQLMLIVAALLAVFYPVIFGDISLIDDQDIVEAIKNTGSWSLQDLFIPHMRGGLYYRPILFLSFYLDKYLFNLDPGFMHLHNVILHVTNALLVFWLAYQLIPDRKEGKNLLPLLSALLFGLHPITTEPVSWIAGRTDVLASTFILLSANSILLFKKLHAYRYVVSAALFMCLGFLTKEVTLAFLPGAFLLMSSRDCAACETVQEQEASSQGRKYTYQKLFFLLFAIGAILFFFLMRHFAVQTNEGRIRSTIRFMQRDTIHVGLVFLQALGFYVKKIFFPFPLNFTIREVDPLYELIGFPVVALCFLIISKRNQMSALFMSGIFLITPAFIIATGQIAWTLFAERYLYLPTAFIMIATVFFISSLMQKMPALAMKKEVYITLLLSIMAVATFHRSTVWKDDLTLLKDSVAKNPRFYYVRGAYARALALRGDIQNARIQFTIANEYNKTRKRLKIGNNLFQLRYWEVPEMGLAYLLVRENRISEAITAYEKIIRASDGQSADALNNILFLYGGILYDTKSRYAFDRLRKKMSFYSEKLYNTSEHADAFYWLGKIFLMRGERREALAYFRKAESKLNPDNDYKVITQKLITRLENK